MKNAVPLFSLLIALLLIPGCSSEKTGASSGKTWYQQGKSRAETVRDLAACQNEAFAYGRSPYVGASGGAGRVAAFGMINAGFESKRENNIVRTCMISKGYSLVDKNSPMLSRSPSKEFNQQRIRQLTQSSPDSVINAKLLGQWLFVPQPEKGDLSQLEIDFLPQNRYQLSSSLIKTNEPPHLPILDNGRYFFAGDQLVTWSDKDEKPDPPVDFSLTDSQLTLYYKKGYVVFQKQAR